MRGDRRALGELAPIDGLMVDGAWKAVDETFGATADLVVIDAARTIAAIRAAAGPRAEGGGDGRARSRSPPRARLRCSRCISRSRGSRRHTAARSSISPTSGRSAPTAAPGAALRWVSGVAVVSDGDGLCATRDGEAAREWLFAMPRPALVIADGPFAEVAWESGIEVVAFAGLDRLGLAVAAARGGAGIVVPMRTDLPGPQLPRSRGDRRR